MRVGLGLPNTVPGATGELLLAWAARAWITALAGFALVWCGSMGWLGFELPAAEVILAPPCAAASWAIGDLLMSQRRWGTTRCRKFLVRNQINETKAVGALTERQRRLLAAQLRAVRSEAGYVLAAV